MHGIGTMRRRCLLARRARAQASVEMVLVLPLMLMLIFAFLEYQRGVTLRHSLDSGTADAALYLAYNPTDCCGAGTTPLTAIRNRVAILATGASADTVTLSLCEAAVSGACQPPTLTFGQKVRVEARAAYVVAAPVPFLSISSRTLVVFHEMTVQKYP